MADEVRIEANQRLDLIDITRWKQAIQEMMGNLFGDVFGNPEYFTGAARNTLERPNIVCNFMSIAGPGPMEISVGQSYTSGADSYAALVYDTDGLRLTGPNSVDPKVFTVTNPLPAATDRYLIARRNTVNTTAESRKHYTAPAGEYSATMSTQTMDDWTISESQFQTGSNTPAASQIALRDAGWIDIATFQVDGVPSVTVVTPNLPPMLTAEPLTWAVAPPVIDRVPMNLFEMITALAQIVKRLRYGAGITSRNWHDDPTFDAAFEEQGGIRFSDGATGLLDRFIRLYSVAFDQFTHITGVPVNADDLMFSRAKAFIAGDLANNGAPKTTAPGAGYLYCNVIDGVPGSGVLTAVPKHWSIVAQDFMPNQQSVDPWTCPAATHDTWRLQTGTARTSWTIYYNGAIVGDSVYLNGGIDIPNLCRIFLLHIDLSVIPAGLPVNISFTCGVRRRTKATGAVSVLSTYAYTVADGGIWAAGGYGQAKAYDEAIDGTFLVNNELYQYQTYSYLTVAAAVAAQDYFNISGGSIYALIREASHIY